MEDWEVNESLQEKVRRLETELGCDCDLDKWQPTISTGHSEVCRIHIIVTGIKPFKDRISERPPR